MTETDLQKVEDAFVAAIDRCKTIGCRSSLAASQQTLISSVDFIEIHGAHGYLLHSFYSPLSNTRTDAYGGQPLANRLAFPLRLIKSCRTAWPDKPLFVRISATDWARGPEQEGSEWKQWGIEQSKILVGELIKLGVDLVDCSSGGNWVKQEIAVKPGYQVRLSDAVHVLVMTPSRCRSPLSSRPHIQTYLSVRWG